MFGDKSLSLAAFTFVRNISEITRANRYGCPFSVAFLDLDDFKGINDRFGHGAGDRLLRQITDAIQTSIRSSDMIGRLGGDEFAVLFPETSQLAV